MRKFQFSVIKRNLHQWIKPEGYDTGIKVYNSVTKNKQPLIVRNENLVSWYTCGPTVYDSSHIGHASCYVKLDIIQRILREHFSLNLITVMNVTDIDDKLIARSQETQISVEHLSKQYEKEFWSDFEALNICKPDHILRVMENMELIKEYISKLMNQKQAYRTSDGSVYFDVQSYDGYGKFQNIDSTLESDGIKKSPMDFALWKAAKPGEISWESEWGPGRPGWHIECSALASHALGSKIDIHSGGIDLCFPHHENEEAQSCSIHSTPQWVNYWLHAGILHLKSDTKMSKSRKNTISISEMLKSTTSEDFRMACLMSHYRSSMEFSDEFMATAASVLRNYKNFIENCNNYINGYTKTSIDSELIISKLVQSTNDVHIALIDDFNTPSVINALNDLVFTINSQFHSGNSQKSETSPQAVIIAASHFIKDTLHAFGINLNTQILQNSQDFSDIMDILNNFRQQVRQLGIHTKNKEILTLCDSVRDDLKKNGVVVKDHGKLSSWSV